MTIIGAGFDNSEVEGVKAGSFTIVSKELVKEGKKYKATFSFEYDNSSRVKKFELKVSPFQGIAEGTYTDIIDGENQEEGALTIIQQCQPELKLHIKYKDDPTRPTI